jgi:hypothetical protein
MSWVPKGSKIVPFKSEMEAFSFVKEEAENSPEEDLDKVVDKRAGKQK